MLTAISESRPLQKGKAGQHARMRVGSAKAEACAELQRRHEVAAGRQRKGWARGALPRAGRVPEPASTSKACLTWWVHRGTGPGKEMRKGTEG